MRLIRVFLVITLLASVVASSVGCKKADPDQVETQRLAQEFAYNVFVTRDPDAAMALVVPITGFGYVTKEAIDSTILNDRQKKCTTRPDSVEVGPTSPYYKLPVITDADKAKGVEDRVQWSVGYAYLCGTQTRETTRSTRIVLEKVNGKWGVAKCTF